MARHTTNLARHFPQKGAVLYKFGAAFHKYNAASHNFGAAFHKFSASNNKYVGAFYNFAEISTNLARHAKFSAIHSTNTRDV